MRYVRSAEPTWTVPAWSVEPQAMAWNPSAENQAMACEPEIYAAPHTMPVYAEADTAREHPQASNDNAPERERYTDGNNAASYTDGNRTGDWMQTFTGRQFWPMDPRADEIFIEDVAHSLAMQCRYAGHCLRFYSVAEHAVLMARWFIAQGMHDEAEQALHHDDPETYLVDVPRPVKPFLPGYKDAEQRVWLAVAERFGLRPVLSPRVHDADSRILVDEMTQNMTPPAKPWNIPAVGLGVTLQFWTPEQAEAEYLATYWSLIETRRH